MLEPKLNNNIKAATDRINTLLLKNAFVRDVSLTASGTLASQAITIVAAPILTRLYTPGDYGVLAVFAAIFMATMLRSPGSGSSLRVSRNFWANFI